MGDEVPKLSVYIADELWNKAKALEPSDGPSQILQAALVDRIERVEARPYAVLSDHLREAQEKAAARVANRLAEAYQTGYELGLFFAGDLMWDALNAFASVGFDLPKMQEMMELEDFFAFTEDGEDYRVDWDKFWTAHGHSLSIETAPTGVVLEGFIDACRNLWEAAGGPALTPASAPAVPASRPVDLEDGGATSKDSIGTVPQGSPSDGASDA